MVCDTKTNLKIKVVSCSLLTNNCFLQKTDVVLNCYVLSLILVIIKVWEWFCWQGRKSFKLILCLRHNKGFKKLISSWLTIKINFKFIENWRLFISGQKRIWDRAFCPEDRFGHQIIIEQDYAKWPWMKSKIVIMIKT